MMDVDHQVSAVRRQVGTRVLDAGEARVVTISQAYDTGVEDLWDACTNPERIPRWFLPVTGELRLGGRYQLEGNAGGVIETCEPPRRFSATWEMGDQVSWVEVRVEPDGDARARLVLEHIARIADDDGFWDQFGPGAVGVGWDLVFLGLGLHLRTGDTLDAAEFEAWTVSDEGRRFVAGCSDGWREASVAAGTAEAQAAAAADRTTAFYTGAPGS